jgi:hypothetical protein
VLKVKARRQLGYWRVYCCARVFLLTRPSGARHSDRVPMTNAPSDISIGDVGDISIGDLHVSAAFSHARRIGTRLPRSYSMIAPYRTSPAAASTATQDKPAATPLRR